MADFPHNKVPIDHALWCVRHHRLHELVVEGLTTSELTVVAEDMRSHLSRARLHLVRAHVVGAGLTGIFLTLALLLLMVGPTEVLAWSQLHNVWQNIDAQVVFWGIMIVVLIAGATTADYILRRRLRIAQSYGHRVHELTHALGQVTGALDC